MSETGAKGSGWVLPSASLLPETLGPMCGSPASARKEAVSKSSSVGPILIVEDDRDARLAITRILRHQGFAVSEAGTVDQAILALAQRPRWILLDLMLPDGSGIDVLRKVTSER